MIIGLGTDLLDIRRIEKTYARFGRRFLMRCFTDIEQDQAFRSKARQESGQANSNILAKRFAAKEACVKALGTGFAQGISHRDIGVHNDAAGKPELILSGKARDRLEALTPQGMVARVHLTLTDEPPLAQAMVVLEAIAKLE